MATPIYKRILDAKKRGKSVEVEETPIAFTAVTGKPNAAYADNTMADVVEATEEIEDNASKTSLGKCVDGVNDVTGKECETAEDRKQDRIDNRDRRKKERLDKNDGGTGVGDFLRGIFGGKDSGTVAKLVEDPSGATIVKDSGTPIEKHDKTATYYTTPAKDVDPPKGDAALKILTGGGTNQNLGEGDLILDEDGNVLSGEYTGPTEGEDTEASAGSTDNLPASTEEFVNPQVEGQTWSEFVDAPCGSPGKPFGSGMCVNVKPGTTSKGDPEKYQFKNQKITEKTPGEDAQYAYNMGWADTVMQNWQQGAERRGNQRNENKNMNALFKGLNANERNELKDVIKTMKDNGTAPRGKTNQRLAAIQQMQLNATNPDYADNAAYSNFKEDGKYSQNWGSGSRDANVNLFNKDTRSYKDKVLNQNRNNKGADVSVGGQGGGQVKTVDKVDATETTRNKKASDLTEEEALSIYPNKEAWLKAQREEAGATDGGDNAFGEDNNPFANMDIKDFAKSLKTKSLTEFMKENPIGVKPNAEINPAPTVLDNVTVEGERIPESTKTTKTLTGDAVNDMTDEQKKLLKERGIGTELDGATRELIEPFGIDTEGVDTKDDRTNRLVKRMGDAFNADGPESPEGLRLKNKLQRKGIQVTDVEKQIPTPGKFKLKRKPFTGRPGY